MSGISLRVKKLFGSKRNVVISALDHVMEYGDQPGIEDARQATTGQINASGYNFYIAENAQATGRWLGGAVDDLRVYGRALSPEEIAGLAGITAPIHKPF